MVTMIRPLAVAVPEDDDFVDEQGDPVGFLEAPELEAIVRELTRKHKRFEHLEEFEVRCLWRRKGAADHGKLLFGTCQRPGGLLRYFAGCDFLVLVNADACRDQRLSGEQIEAVVYHELLHTGKDEKGRPVTLPHDYEGFAAEVAEYGLWRGDLKIAARAVKQLPLSEVEGS